MRRIQTMANWAENTGGFSLSEHILIANYNNRLPHNTVNHGGYATIIVSFLRIPLPYLGMGRLPTIVGLVIAMGFGFVAVSQADSLRNTGAPLTSGSLQTIVNSQWFFVELLVVVLVVGALAAVVMMALKGRI